MHDSRAARQGLLLTASLLAASLPAAVLPANAGPAGPASAVSQQAPPEVTGEFSDFLIGQFAENQADPNAAAQQFLRAVANAPANPELLHQALLASIMSGRPESIALARRLPDDAMAQMLLGTEAARTGDWHGAVLRFNALPASQFTRLMRPFLAAWAEQGAGHTDRALALLEPLLNDPHLRGAYALHAGMIADLAGRTADAARYYQLADTEGGPHSLRLAQILASFAARQGRQADALRILGAAADATPVLRIALPAVAADLRRPPVASATEGMAEAYLDLAAALQQDSQNQFAMVLVRLSLVLRPDFTAARILAADMLETDGHPDRALDVLAAMGADDPLSAMVLLRRADLEGRLGQDTAALNHLHDLALAYPDSSLPDAEAGDILRVKGDYPAAAAAYGRAMLRIAAPSEFDWPLFYDQAVAYEQAGQWPLAEADFKKALQLEPNQPMVLNYLGYSWAERGEHLDDARRMIEAAARQRPDDGAIVDSLGWVMLRQGDADGAVRTLERATELNPEDPTINTHLGDAYWAAGRKTEATYQWRRALTLNPVPAEAAKLQAKLHETTAQAATGDQRLR